MYWIYEDFIYILLTGKCNDSALHGLDKFTKNAWLRGCRILRPQLLQHLSNFNKSTFHNESVCMLKIETNIWGKFIHRNIFYKNYHVEHILIGMLVNKK